MQAGCVTIDGRTVISSGSLFVTAGEKVVFSPFVSNSDESFAIQVLIDESPHGGDLRFERNGDFLTIISQRKWDLGAENTASHVIVANDAASEFVEIRFSTALIGDFGRHIMKISYCILEVDANGPNIQTR